MLKYIIKSQNNLGWNGAKEVIQFNVLLKAEPAMRSAKLLRALFAQVLTTSQGRDYTSSLGILVHCSSSSS